MIAFLPAGLLAMALGQSAASTPVPPLEVRLARPSYAPLEEAEVRAAFSDRRLVLDATFPTVSGVAITIISSGGCVPVERFHADGRWEGQDCGLGAGTLRLGTWTARRGLVCVRVGRTPETCRFVWRSPAPDGLLLTEGSPAGDWINPYRALPLGS